MKAVIVDLRGKNAAALSDDGCILKVKNKKYAIGQVIKLRRTARVSTRFVVWAASAAAAVVVFGTGAWAYFSPYTYVSLDVNPSIEYTVNRFDRVLSATAVNDDGAEILQNLDLNNKTIDEAVKDTVDKIAQNGYFEGTDPGGVMISTSSGDEQDAQQLADELKSTAEGETQDTDVPVEVEAVSVGLARVQEARTLGTTPGKLNLVEKLQASSGAPDSINVQDWLKKPVKEIMKAIKQNRKDASSAVSEPEDPDSSAASSQSEVVSAPVDSDAAPASSASSAPSSRKVASAPAQSQVKNRVPSVKNSGKPQSAPPSSGTVSTPKGNGKSNVSPDKSGGAPDGTQSKPNNGKSNVRAYP